MTEEKIENWEEEAWEDIAKANEETQKNLKDNEALFDGMAYYTIPKNELEEIVAIISRDPDTLEIQVLWTESDEEIIEDYIERLGDKSPTGTFIIKFWGYDEQTSYEYDEWDYTTSINYEIEQLSNYNFEKALKQIKRVKEVNKRLWEKIINLQDCMEKGNPAGGVACLADIKRILYKEIDEVQ